MPRTPVAYLESIMRYARHKVPKTLEEALVMLELIGGIAEEGLEEEKAKAA
jgi:hypothetical protein